MPSEGKEPFMLDFLHHGLPFEVFVARISNLAARDLTGYERAIQFHSKPLAKFPVICERTPDARNWSLEFNTLLNSVVHIKQPQGCILTWRDTKSNRVVVLYGGLLSDILKGARRK